MDERDIHERKKRIKTVLRRLEESEDISSKNASTLKEFNNHLKTVRSVKLDRRHFYLNRLSKIAKWVGEPFSEMEKEDVKKIQGRLNCISVIVHGKTGSRQVLLPPAEPYLATGFMAPTCPEYTSREVARGQITPC